MKKIKREAGITLTALVVTVLILLIISAIGITTGVETAESIERKKFYDELQLVQARVDVIYRELKTGVKTENDLGGELYSNRQDIINRTLNEVTDKVGVVSDFRYYTNQALEKYLGMEDVTQSVLINWKTREVISVGGIKIDGVRYYKGEYTYKPDYTENTPKDVTITTATEKIGDIIKVSVAVTSEDGIEITDFTLKYKLESEEAYRIANNNYFETAISGKYLIEVLGNGINTETTEITLEE